MTDDKFLKLKVLVNRRGLAQNPYEQNSIEWVDWQIGFMAIVEEVDLDPTWDQAMKNGFAAGLIWLEANGSELP